MRKTGEGLPGVRALRAIGFVCFCVLALFTAGHKPCGKDHRAIPINLIISNAGSTPLPATCISGRLLVGYGGFVENQNPKLNYKRYLMLTVENGRITKREFQDRKFWDR